MLSPILFALAVVVPTDRSYVLAETDRPADEVAQCAAKIFEKAGVGKIAPTEYGSRVDFHYSNIGGAVKEPTLTLEVHDGERRTLVMYGFGTWRGAVKNVWKDTAKRCFPEVRDTAVTKVKG